MVLGSKALTPRKPPGHRADLIERDVHLCRSSLTDVAVSRRELKPCPDLAAYKEIMKDLIKTRDSEVCYNVLRQRKSLFLCVRPDWDVVKMPDEK